MGYLLLEKNKWGWEGGVMMINLQPIAKSKKKKMYFSQLLKYL